MELEGLYSSKEIEVFYNQKTNSIVWKPLGGVNQFNWEKSFQHGLTKFLQIPHPKTWLNDTSLLEYIEGTQISWTRGFVNETLKQIGGIYKVAFIHPNNVFGAISVDLYIRQTLADPDNNLIIKLFADVRSAENWLADSEVMN